jgi:5-methylcytosine-specific restriction protein A
MDFISKKQDVINNIITFEGYMASKDKEQRGFALDLMKHSKTMCVYKVNGENHFAPSRFCGFKENSMAAYLKNEEKETRDTNAALDKVVGKHFSNDTIEEKFLAFATSKSLEVAPGKKAYWRVKDERGKNLDIKL